MSRQNGEENSRPLERQIKQAVPSEAPRPQGGMYDPAVRDVYRGLFDVVRSCLASNIDKHNIEQAVEKVIKVFLDNPYSALLLLSYTTSKDNYLAAHIVNDVILAVGFAVNLNLPEQDVRDIGLCAFCHDIGMLEYIDLFQKAIKLSEQESILVQLHPEKSAQIFKPVFSEKIINGILDVHEQVNGGGYPQKKLGVEISLIGKIVGICDAFEALTHPRKYRKAFSPYEAMKIIIKQKDVIFDAKVLKKFVEFMSIYPVGSLVYLNTGETAIVIGANRGNPTRSSVQVLLNIKREFEHSPKTVNLLEDQMLYIRGCVDPKEEGEILHFLKPRGENEL